MNHRVELDAIAIVRSCYREKFGAPRQAGLAPHAQALVEMLPPYNDPAMVDGLQQFSHLWLITRFHQHEDKTPGTQVRPPRLGGNEKIGVFASRSSFRPNHLALSAVKLEKICIDKGVQLHVSGLDMIDGTPVLDIKPYVPYADAITTAQAGYAQAPPASKPVHFSEQALTQLQQCDQPQLYTLVEETLAQDPKPAYHQDPQRVYGLSLWSYNIKWQSDEQRVLVLAIETNPE